MFQKSLFAVFATIIATSAVSATGVSLCSELVDRVPTRYSVSVYNMSSRIADLEAQERTPQDDQLLSKLVRMRDVAVALDSNEKANERSRCLRVAEGN